MERQSLSDQWDREGGGDDPIMDGGRLFEKAGVNVSAFMERHRKSSKTVPESAAEFYATVSLVIHPINPMIYRACQLPILSTDG